VTVKDQLLVVGAPKSFETYKEYMDLQSRWQKLRRISQRNAGLVFTFTTDNHKQRATIEACTRADVLGRNSHKCLATTDGCRRSNCASGINTVVLKDDSVLVSSPGAYYSQGVVDRFKRPSAASNLRYNRVNEGFEYSVMNTTSRYGKILTKESNYPDVHREDVNAMKTCTKKYGRKSNEHCPKMDINMYAYDSNLVGLSLAVLDENIQGGNIIAAGAPSRYQFSQLGAVVLRKVDSQGDDVGQISGYTVGERFGSSIVAFDFDGDGMDELLVGAPFWSNKTKDYSCSDCGRVYYFRRQKPDNYRSFVLVQIIDSPHNSAQFGFSMAHVGNTDSLEGDEVVVGMPTLDDNRGGVAVLSFKRETGLFEITQVIKGIDLTENPELDDSSLDFKYFGMSLSKSAANLDGKNQQDIVVGSQNKVSILYSRQVVSMESGFPKCEFEDFNQDKNLDLDSDSINGQRGGRDAIIFPAKFCIDKIQQNVRMNVTFDYKLGSSSRRVLISSKDGDPVSSATLNFDKGKCQTIEAYIILANVHDFSSDIEIKMDTFLIEPKRTKRATSLVPILDPAAAQKTQTLKLAKNCGDDNICIASIKIDTEIKITRAGKKAKKLTINQSDYLATVKVKMTNTGENAWNTYLMIVMPDYVHQKRVDEGVLCDTIPKEDFEDYFPVLDFPIKDFPFLYETASYNVYQCAVQADAAFKTGTIEEKDIGLSFSEIPGTGLINNQVNIQFFVKSKSKLENTVNESVKIKVQTETNVGKSISENDGTYVEFNFALGTPEPEELVQTYTYMNTGPSDIKSYKVDFEVPVGLYDDNYKTNKKIYRISQERSGKDFDLMQVQYRKCSDKGECEWAMACDRLDYDDAPSIIKPLEKSGEIELSCDMSKVLCQKFTCSFDGDILKAESKAEFQIKTKIVPEASQVLMKNYKIKSTSNFEVLSLPYDKSFSKPKKGDWKTDIQSGATVQYIAAPLQNAVSFEWILITIIIAIIIVCLLFCCLYQCGCLRRKRRDEIDGMGHSATRETGMKLEEKTPMFLGRQTQEKADNNFDNNHSGNRF